MAEILSQSQIDELLSGLSSGDVNIQELNSAQSKIKEYDFRSPKKITKETIRLLMGIYENYCRLFSSRLTSMLRLICDVTAEQVEESIYHEYNNALEDYVLMGLIDVKYPDNTISENQILMEVSKSLSFVIIDRLLGGNGEEYGADRDYTDIELSLLKNVLSELIKLMGSSWENTLKIETKLDKIETNSRFIQSINYNDTVVVIVLNVLINELSGKVTICIPSNILDEVKKKSNAYSKNISRKSNVDEQKTAILDSIKSSKLTIKGVLGSTEATLKDLLNIKPGDLIILDKKISANVEVKVEDAKWFEGKWGTRKNKSAIKIYKTIH